MQIVESSRLESCEIAVWVRHEPCEVVGAAPAALLNAAHIRPVANALRTTLFNVIHTPFSLERTRVALSAQQVRAKRLSPRFTLTGRPTATGAHQPSVICRQAPIASSAWARWT